MRWLKSLALPALIGTILWAAEEKPQVFRFAKKDLGKVPAGWKSAQTHEGKDSSIWKVVADDTAPSKKGYVLAQTAESPNRVFNLCVLDDSRFKAGEISVAFKAIRGENDQGGGIVWRYRDANNYY